MIPSYVAPYLWSYDLEKIDLRRDKRRIILNVLDLGSQEATDWLLRVYTPIEIKEVLCRYAARGELNQKSLHYWTWFFSLEPHHLIKSRF